MNRTDEHLDQLINDMQALTDRLESMGRLLARNVKKEDQEEANSIAEGLDTLRDKLIDLQRDRLKDG